MNIKSVKIIEKMKQKGYSIATIESCTGGQIVNSLTDVPGCSDVVVGGYVVYSIPQKIAVGVSSDVIMVRGVYSKECAENMAETCFLKTNAMVNIATTGRFEELVNEVDIAIYFDGQIIFSEKLVLPFEMFTAQRSEKKKYVTDKILDILLGLEM